jgi:hypothetical protein
MTLRMSLRHRDFRYESEADVADVADEKQNQEHRKDEKNPEWERFEGFACKITTVPREEVYEQRRKWEREKKRAG